MTIVKMRASKVLSAKVSEAQQRNAYRTMVQNCLVKFYGATEEAAVTKTTDWWQRLEKSPGFRSGLFMHAEAINTAAHLIDAEVIPLTTKNGPLYCQLWKNSLTQIITP